MPCASAPANGGRKLFRRVWESILGGRETPLLAREVFPFPPGPPSLPQRALFRRMHCAEMPSLSLRQPSPGQDEEFWESACASFAAKYMARVAMWRWGMAWPALSAEIERFSWRIFGRKNGARGCRYFFCGSAPGMERAGKTWLPGQGGTAGFSSPGKARTSLDVSLVNQTRNGHP